MRKFLCWLLGHDEGVTIIYNWAITECRRCRRFLGSESIREGGE